uniref:Uncharacterized protein n=1 Tax=Ananas comosus var. bracteatus TaxID=296719 RepID=A0A6V7Q1C2_ANACO|nr:unnamed protein product [Ananas comosus var. bracteatus]
MAEEAETSCEDEGDPRPRAPTLSPHRPPIIPRAKRPPSPPPPLLHSPRRRRRGTSPTSPSATAAASASPPTPSPPPPPPAPAAHRRRRRRRPPEEEAPPHPPVAVADRPLVQLLPRPRPIRRDLLLLLRRRRRGLRVPPLPPLLPPCPRRVPPQGAPLPRVVAPDPASFVCADCRPIPKLLFTNNRSSSSSSSTSNNNHSSLSVSLDDLVIEARSDAKKKAELASFAMNNAFNKAAMAKHAADRAKAALRVVLGNSPNELKANGDSAIPMSSWLSSCIWP